MSYRGCPLSEVIVYKECIYRSTFSLSFVGRFVLFQSVFYQRFHCHMHVDYYVGGSFMRESALGISIAKVMVSS